MDFAFTPEQEELRAQAKKPFCGGVRCFSMSAHIAGVSVRAMNPERATEITIVIANCL